MHQSPDQNMKQVSEEEEKVNQTNVDLKYGYLTTNIGLAKETF